MEFNPIWPDEAVSRVGRREVADPRAGNRMTAPVDKKGPLRNDDPRLRAQRHDGVVCDPEGVTRTRSSSASPKPSRPRCARSSTRTRQLPTHKHPKVTSGGPASSFTTRHLSVVAERRRMLFAKLTRRRLERSFIAKTAAPSQRPMRPRPFAWTADPSRVCRQLREACD
jgi:hypothetical protein